jgi:protein TonB
VRQDPRARFVGLSGVFLLHAVVIYALVTGLARKAIEVLPAPIETKILEELAVEEEPPPPPPPPDFKPPPPDYIPPPEIVISTPAPVAANAITTVTTEKPSARTAPVINARRNCREPEYPPVSQRLGEKGTVVLAFLIGTDGKVKESRVDKTSGFPRLDEAAREALGRCKFVPGTTNGAPEEAWANIKYTWKIPD